MSKEVLDIVKEIYSQTKSELKNSKIQKSKEIKSCKKNPICGEVHIEKDHYYVQKQSKKEKPIKVDPYDLKKCGASYLLKTKNMSVSEVSKELNLPYSLVDCWNQKLLREGSLFRRSKVSGRPRKITDIMIEDIRNLVYLQPSGNLVKDIKEEIKEKHSIDIGNSTIYKILKQMGKFKILKEVPVLSDQNKQKRLMYCSKMLTKSFDKTVFSDESPMVGRGRKRLVFHPNGAIMRKKIWSTQPFSIMVWGCISSKGKIALKIYQQEKKIDADAYMETLSQTLPIINKTLGKHWYFVQDNAKPHVSSVKRDFFKINNIKLRDHPPQSPVKLFD